MSSANQDKALQVRPPIAVYTFDVEAANCNVFYIPGVPNWIMGQAPGGAHTMITNFITLQAEGGAVYVKFFGRASPPGPNIGGGDGFVANTGVDSFTAPGPNPSPDPGGGILVGEVPLRFDLSDLQAKQTGDVVTPIQYMSYTGVDGAILRVWRSSGR